MDTTALIVYCKRKYIAYPPSLFTRERSRNLVRRSHGFSTKTNYSPIIRPASWLFSMRASFCVMKGLPSRKSFAYASKSHLNQLTKLTTYKEKKYEYRYDTWRWW